MTPVFTPRERQVVQALWDGWGVKEIAWQLGISYSGVIAALQRARRKTGTRTTIALLRAALRLGVLTV